MKISQDQYGTKLTIHLSFFYFLQEGLEPTKRWRITADPEELNTLQSTEVTFPLAVPNVLKNGSEWRYTNTSTDEQHGLVVQEVLRRRTERTVDHDSGKDAVEGRVSGGTEDLALAALLALILLAEIATARLRQSLGKVADDTDVDGDVVLLRGAIFL